MTAFRNALKVIVPYFLITFRYAFSIENSFPNEAERKLFLQMMYQLLLTGKMPFKAKKIMLVGPSDSGKTTWVEPILACLDDDKVVAVTDEGKFSTQLLESDTQLLMMDEYSPGNANSN